MATTSKFGAPLVWLLFPIICRGKRAIPDLSWYTIVRVCIAFSLSFENYPFHAHAHKIYGHRCVARSPRFLTPKNLYTSLPQFLYFILPFKSLNFFFILFVTFHFLIFLFLYLHRKMIIFRKNFRNMSFNPIIADSNNSLEKKLLLIYIYFIIGIYLGGIL